MKRLIIRLAPPGLFLSFAIGACSGASQAPPQVGAPAPAVYRPSASSIADARADSIRHPYVDADVHFMAGMIHHHAQAVLMAKWAPTHGASPAMRAMCARIDVGQRDEIAIMQRWLLDRNQQAPDPDSPHEMMPGMHSEMMPGMLTAEQLAQLDSARGQHFDRLFLTFMIKHHQGAITMVDQLFGSEGAGQNETVFRLASDIYADQTTEIDRMQKMLAALPSGDQHP